MKVLGIERNVVIDFFDKKKNAQVHHEGLKLHLGEEKSSVEGIAVDKPIFVSKERACYSDAEKLAVGDEVTVGYNRYGTFETVFKTSK